MITETFQNLIPKQIEQPYCYFFLRNMPDASFKTRLEECCQTFLNRLNKFINIRASAKSL